MIAWQHLRKCELPLLEDGGRLKETTMAATVVWYQVAEPDAALDASPDPSLLRAGMSSTALQAATFFSFRKQTDILLSTVFKPSHLEKNYTCFSIFVSTCSSPKSCRARNGS